MHWLLDDNPVTDEYVPAAQEVQPLAVVRATTDDQRPAAHTIHASTLVAAVNADQEPA